MTAIVRHFLTLSDLSRSELVGLLARASELKRLRRAGQRPPLFERRTLGMIFEKSSTRTRVAFEAAMVEGGGAAIFLSSRDTQLGRGEPLADTARVLSEMCDAVMIRTFSHATVEAFARAAAVPVINALTDTFHPCQLLADLQTFGEHRGEIAGRKVAWIGDGNNMCNSYIDAALLMGFELAIAAPDEFAPQLSAAARASGAIRVGSDPAAAASGAHLVVTDVWASMGQEEETQRRRQAFAGYQVTAELMARASPDALFMHCLPAHRGEEVAADVIDAPASVVWDEAGNRLHAQKALLEFLLAHSGQ